MSTLLTTFGVPIVKIDRRLSLHADPFENVYFVELEELGPPGEPQDAEAQGAEDAAWLSRIRQGIERAKKVDVEATLLGIW